MEGSQWRESSGYLFLWFCGRKAEIVAECLFALWARAGMASYFILGCRWRRGGLVCMFVVVGVSGVGMLHNFGLLVETGRLITLF